MDVLPLHFRTLYYCGLWWDGGVEQHRFARYIWKPFVVGVIFGFTLSQLVALFAHRHDLFNLSECLYTCATYLTLCFKLVNFLSRRDDMLALLVGFRDRDHCAPRTSDELDLLLRHSRLSSFVFKFFVGGAEAIGALFYAMPLLASDDRRRYPFKSYEILDSDNRLYYWLNYAFQTLAIVIGIAVNACLDTILCGLLILLCGQIDLCCHRFSAASKGDATAIGECVKHHGLVRDAARQLESFFMRVIVPFLLFALIALATTVFILSQNGIVDAASITSILYLAAINVQLLLYCWFGNELILKGEKISDAMYNADWEELKASDRKSLLYVMVAGQKPLTISFHGFCVVSLEIYIWVLKTSYAAYNILKTMAMND